jgi:hypothetical protein
MPHPRTILLLLSGAILLQSRPVTGQDIPSSYRFVEHSQEGGFFAGVSSINPGQLELGPKSADVFGGRYAVMFGGALAFEGVGTFFKGRRDVIDIRRDEGERVLGESTIDLLAIEGRFRLNLTGQRSWRRMQPFIGFGGGMALSSNLDRTLEDEASMPPVDRWDYGSKFIAALSGGMNLHVSSRLVLRLDGVMNLWKITTPPGWIINDTDLGVLPEDEWVSAKHLSVGASFRF